jgi:hypothetical protein
VQERLRLLIAARPNRLAGLCEHVACTAQQSSGLFISREQHRMTISLPGRPAGRERDTGEVDEKRICASSASAPVWLLSSSSAFSRGSSTQTI